MSSEDIVVDVQGVSKRYEIYAKPSDRLKQMVVPPLWRGVRGIARARGVVDRTPPCYFREFWALTDVSLRVRRGETIGIIGRNGSGKSTLLQLIAGTLSPTRGQVDVAGRVAALLELGSGFNPEFTGRENVRMNARILGLSDVEIDSAFDRIVEFADIGDFIDQPVKTYSSGMFVRLAFAVQAHSNPQLLIIDEALSVGDIFFQQKCFNHIKHLQSTGVTIVFVSHDTSAVQRICDRAIWLVNGRVRFDGPPDEAVSRYFAGRSADGDGAPAEGDNSIDLGPGSIRGEMVEKSILHGARSQHGEGRLEIVAATVRNHLGDHSLSVQMLTAARISILIRARESVMHPMAGLHLYDRFNTLIFASGTHQLRKPLPALNAGDEIVVRFELELRVQAGEYTFSLGCAEPSPDDHNLGIVHHRYEGLGPLKVYNVEAGVLPFYGVAQLPFKIEAVERLK